MDGNNACSMDISVKDKPEAGHQQVLLQRGLPGGLQGGSQGRLQGGPQGWQGGLQGGLQTQCSSPVKLAPWA